MSVDDQILEIALPVITADPVSVFKAKNSAEALNFLEQRATVERIWREIIQSSSFLGCCFERREGGSVCLTTSVRNPQWWQLTIFGKDGLPAYHEDYEKVENSGCGGHAFSKLCPTLARYSIKHQIVVRIRRKEKNKASEHNYGVANRTSGRV